MQRPFVVVYRVSRISYLVGRLFVKVAHIALVNLLAGRRLVPELMQGQMEPGRIAEEVQGLWAGPRRAEVERGLADLRSSLGGRGAASRAADAVVELIGSQGRGAEVKLLPASGPSAMSGRE
jgi:lipid-A-disaccharide synthase